MPRKNKQAKQKRGKGRPKKPIPTLEEMREQVRLGMRKTKERQLSRSEIDVKQLCEKVDGITHRNRFTKEEMQKLRDQVDLLYHEYVLDKWEEDAEQNAEQSKVLQALAIVGDPPASKKQMSPEEWNELHGLRKDGKGLKPGPRKRKPKSVFDMELEPGEPVDWEAIEKQWLEHEIARKAAEVKPLLGKRLRDDKLPDLKTKSEQPPIWI